MPKLRVAFITSETGGLAQYVAHIIPQLKDDIEPYFVTYTDNRTAEDELVKSIVKKPYRIIKNQSAQSILETIELLKKKKIDVINVHIGTTARKMWLHYAALLSQAQLHGIPNVMTIHDVLPFESMYVDPAAVELLYSLGNSYLVGNELEAFKLSRYFGIPKEIVRVARHGVYSLFDRKKYTQKSARKSLKLPADAPVILFFGFPRPHKGLKYLIKAFTSVVKQVPNAQLVIVSDVQNPLQTTEFIDRIQASGVAENIHFIHKYIRSFEVEKYFRAASFVVLPYTQVSQSGVLYLAYAFEKPVIVTSVFAEANEIDKNFGLIVSAGRVSPLTQAIVELSKNPETLNTYRMNLARWNGQQSIWRETAATCLELYRAATAQAAPLRTADQSNPLGA